MDAQQVISELKSQQNVSRETIKNLQTFAALLERWNRKINLISPSSMPNLWDRHILDAAQLAHIFHKTPGN